MSVVCTLVRKSVLTFQICNSHSYSCMNFIIDGHKFSKYVVVRFNNGFQLAINITVRTITLSEGARGAYPYNSDPAILSEGAWAK